MSRSSNIGIILVTSFGFKYFLVYEILDFLPFMLGRLTIVLFSIIQMINKDVLINNIIDRHILSAEK
jgi:hypothetical protein